MADTLRHYVEDLHSETDAKGMNVGYEVYSLDRHKTLASYQEDKTFVPASVLKLLVTAAASGSWSKDKRFPTKVYMSGKLSSSGVLNGDIELKGYGDPVLTVKKLAALAKSLKDKGVRRVKGRLVVDDSYFDNKRLGVNWMWDDEPYDYAAPIGALSVNESTVNVMVEPSELSHKPRILIKPLPEYVKVINHAETVSGKDEDLTITRKRLKNEILIKGSIGKDYKGDEHNGHHYYEEGMSIQDPAHYTGSVFYDQLKHCGISFQHTPQIKQGKIDKHGKLMAKVYSPPLDQILKKQDKDSDNFIAEMLTKQLGAGFRHEGSTKAGLSVIKDYVQGTLGVDSGFVQKDGSGLSRLNVISPDHFIQLLKGIDNKPYRQRFISYLPVAGVDGTLKKRLKDTPAEGNIKAKTGSMNGVNSLVGFVKSKNGERLAFSIMTGGVYKSKYAQALQDKMAVAMAKYPDLPDPGQIPDQRKYPLSKKLDPILNDKKYRRVIKGAMVYSTKRGKMLYENNAQGLLTPGSNTKLLTASAALTKLGPDYRFRTNIYTAGKIHNGLLNGDLIIKGYGDPTISVKGSLNPLNGPTLERMASDIKKSGIHRIKGNILVDTSAFTDEIYAPGWTWDNESKPFEPQISALSVNQGTVRFDYSPGKKPGMPIRLKQIPAAGYVSVINKAVTGKKNSKSNLKIQRGRGKNIIRITGSLPANDNGGHTSVTVEKPYLYTGYLLRDQLKEKGVRLLSDTQIKAGKVHDGIKLLKTYHSPPLSHIISYMNHYNNDFCAEMILKTLGLEKDKKGTFENGIDAVHDHLKNLGILSPFDMMDGSGLSGYNQVSAEQLVSLLAAQTHQSTFESFYRSLPEAGEKGLLHNWMRGTSAEHRLRGITGSMPMQRALSGYVKTPDGDLLAYSIETEGYSRASLDRLLDRFGIALSEP
ncbi:PBP4 family serine-type D-alanyl-D-alanine carboxypeptidase [Scopulibacillus daqui]|uniref:PBP4 family serine-type D-alanyl-D-alanine carboxypeptidase n=1 Tax=Scopulibacillus daqui TaxID=1469162 RepID=A0ABS2Q298_9BACL|nr:PBP4 family serine-type D-alanyl-D-alanine carboxypeptidase [Scopulibacillus daqui]